MAIDYNIKRTVREREWRREREREKKIRSIKIKLKFQSESRKTRPVWTGFKIAVRLKLLTHYKKIKVSYEKSKYGLKVDNVKKFI